MAVRKSAPVKLFLGFLISTVGILSVLKTYSKTSTEMIRKYNITSLPLKVETHMYNITSLPLEVETHMFNVTSIPLEVDRDLTDEMRRRRHVAYDVLDLMRGRGFKPVLLSRVEPRKSDNYVVPNVVHYIHFGKTMKFKFINYLNVMGVNKFMKPKYILFHGDAAISGEWWNRTVKEVPNLYHIWRKKPTEIHGRKINYIEHTADITRLQTLYDFGGIFLDNDVMVVKSFDPLRNYDFTLGRETKDLLANGVILARRRSPFLRVWLEAYRNYRPNKWIANSNEMAHRIASILPSLIHVENTTLVFPNPANANLLYHKQYDWSKNYCIHLYLRERYKMASKPEELDKFKKTTVGEVMRFIYDATV